MGDFFLALTSLPLRYKVLFRDLLRYLANLLQTDIIKSEVPTLQTEAVRVLTRMEIMLPFYWCVANTHFLIHIPRKIARFGPIRVTWTYVYMCHHSLMPPLMRCNHCA